MCGGEMSGIFELISIWSSHHSTARSNSPNHWIPGQRNDRDVLMTVSVPIAQDRRIEVNAKRQVDERERKEAPRTVGQMDPGHAVVARDGKEVEKTIPIEIHCTKVIIIVRINIEVLGNKRRTYNNLPWKHYPRKRRCNNGEYGQSYTNPYQSA